MSVWQCERMGVWVYGSVGDGASPIHPYVLRALVGHLSRIVTLCALSVCTGVVILRAIICVMDYRRLPGCGLEHPGGMQAISRGSSAATPPESRQIQTQNPIGPGGVAAIRLTGQSRLQKANHRQSITQRRMIICMTTDPLFCGSVFDRGTEIHRSVGVNK